MALVDGASREEVTRVAAEALVVDQSVAAVPVARLLAALSERGLVRPPEGEPVKAVPGGPDEADELPGLRLRSYDELQELLLIDPIHEVDEAGWPSRAPASP